MRISGNVSLADGVAVHPHARSAGGTAQVVGIERSAADPVAAAFTAAGVVVIVGPSTVASPMICGPQTNVVHRRGAMGPLAAIGGRGRAY